RSAAEKAGGPLALAAAATAAGFFAFLPTPYRGLAELGQIAGVGMLIAFVTSVTVLPALLRLFNPPGEPHPMGYTWLAPVDLFLERNRVSVIVLTALAVIGGAPLLFYLHFDFNPLNLRSSKVESVSTYLDLMKDRTIPINSIEFLAPSLDAARGIAKRIATLPEVAQINTIDTFVPGEQEQKRAMIEKAATALDAALNPKETDPAPTDAENVEALKSTADSLLKIAGNTPGPASDAAKRAAGLLNQLANGDEKLRERAEMIFVSPLKIALEQLRMKFKPDSITLQTLPSEISRDWVTPDGRARVQAAPKGDPNNNADMRQFVQTVLAIEPTANGPAVSIQLSGDTIVKAFFEAGFWALFSITLLLWIALRRITDVLLTLVPLLLAGVVTLEICVIIGLPLNFANVIALPLLLGVGVAFKIYYIMAWRSGKTRLLQSTLTRAVTCSALTTATAFGSLWMSNHPGTSSMGKLLALSLLCTMAAAVLFQPVLMGPPRERRKRA
ncbi:MAG TPA: MMPL family transporter, partial [Xanthobacteraceae bacterium]|nr:MMPL family transporter [Xanthobacteraceae bacterium]